VGLAVTVGEAAADVGALGDIGEVGVSVGGAGHRGDDVAVNDVDASVPGVGDVRLDEIADSGLGGENVSMAELNGRPLDAGDIQALALTNFGHFTSIRFESNAARGFGRHLERLVRDCRTVFDAELDPDQVRHFIRQGLSGLTQPVIVRVTVFDPKIALSHPAGEAHPSVLVTTRPAVTIPQPPLRLRSVRYERDLPAVKHVGLFGALWHRKQAQEAGFDDALFIDNEARISEAATANIGLLDGDRIIWPEAGALPGVTMALISEVHTGPVATASVDLAQLRDANGVFATNSAVGIRAVRSVDDVMWDNEPPSLAVLRKAYESIPPEPL
jgi:branched-subunit amino acid aminotransferase/4-amino-4-deoxychorismate lyase